VETLDLRPLPARFPVGADGVVHRLPRTRRSDSRLRDACCRPPWTIPFEFPVYQYLTEVSVRLLGTDVIPTARFVSVAFFFATLVVLWQLLGELEVKPVHRLVFESLIVVSPLYVFWSRCFMIESTAAFLSMAYLYRVLRALRLKAWSFAVAASVFGTARRSLSPRLGSPTPLLRDSQASGGCRDQWPSREQQSVHIAPSRRWRCGSFCPWLA
jgi:hypothetical protein